MKSSLVRALALASVVLVSMSTPLQARQKAPETEDPSKKNYLIGLDCVKKGDWDGAIDALLQSTYFARNGYAPVSFYWLGVAYEAKNQDLKAIEAGKKYLEQAQGNTDNGHLLLAELYLRNDRLDEAENECLSAISGAGLTEAGARGHYLYGKVFESRHNNDEAMDQYESALGDPPWRYAEAWMAMAELHMKMKNWAVALGQFRSMLVSEHILKGITHSNAGQNRVHRDMGKCLLMIGDHQGALNEWHMALDFDQTDADTHLDLAMMLDTEKHMSAAIEEYKQYIRFSHDAAKVAKAKQRIQMLELQLNPAEPTYQAKPSPYIRKQYQQLQQPQQQEPPAQELAPAKDSGF